MALIELIHVSKDYQNEEVVTPVLHDLNFNIQKGEFVAIMGPSGSGKSTLMHILGFLDKISKGQFLFDGKDVSTLSEDELAVMRGKSIGFVFQAFHLLPRTTVLENVMLPLIYSQVSVQERIDRAKAALDSVGLSHRLEFSPSQLSGGEKQRVAIARALVNNPSVIFADEPTGNLDSKSGLQVMKILQKLNDDGHTIILVTHEKYTADHSKRILRIKDGEIFSDELVTHRQIAAVATDLVK
ncbi:MAG: ABC transporter ATP-binding protein [Candidatus Magasanikbacteria bacterium]|nr:ABC transporter ATP-binding protein [Candidatus Magasanikbacteria bacterium]